MPNYIFNPGTKDFLERDDDHIPDGFRRATQEDKDYFNRKLEYEKSGFLDKLGDAAQSIVGEAARGVLGAAQYLDPLNMDTNSTDQFKAREAAPQFYTPQELERRDRNTVGTMIGGALPQIPIGLVTGGSSLVGQGAILAGRSALSGIATEANESVIAGREFDPQYALVDGVISGVFDLATAGAAKVFHGTSDYFQNAGEKAVAKSARDAAKMPSNDPVKGDYVNAYGTESQDKLINDNIREAKDLLNKQDEKIFAPKNVKRNINSDNFTAQKAQSADHIVELENLASFVENDLDASNLHRLADELDEAVVKANDTTPGSGTPALALRDDYIDRGPNNFHNVPTADEKVADFRRRQQAKKEGRTGDTEPPYDPSVVEPRVPENERLFGVDEKDVPLEDLHGVHEEYQKGIDSDKWKRPREIIVDEAGNPIPEEGGLDLKLESLPTLEGYAKRLRYIADLPSGNDRIRMAQEALPDFVPGTPMNAKEILKKLSDLSKGIEADRASSEGVFAVTKAVREAVEKVQNAKTSAKLFTALRDAEKIARPLKWDGQTIRESLEKAELWGKISHIYKAADHEKYLNVAEELFNGVPMDDPENLAKYLMAKKDVPSRKLGAKLQEALDGKNVWRLSRFFSDDLSTKFRNLPINDKVSEVMSHIGLAPGGLTRDIGDLGRNLGRKMDRKLFPSDEATNVARGMKGFETAPDDVLQSQMRDVIAQGETQQLGKSIMTGGRAAAAYFGLGLGGPLGGLAGYVGTTLADTPKARQFFGNMTQMTGRHLYSAAQVLTNPQWISNPIAYGLKQSALTDFKGDHSDLFGAFKSKKDMISHLEMDPNLLIDQMSETYASVGRVSPELQTQFAQKTFEVYNYVKSKIPATIGTSLVRKDGIPPSYVALRQFALYYTAATDPSSVIEDLRNGIGTKEQVDTLQAVWPNIYDGLKSSIIEAISLSEDPPTINQQARLNVLFGFGKTMNGAFSDQIAQRADQVRQAQRKQQKTQRSTPSSGASRAANDSINQPHQLDQLENSQSVYG